jgi:hypothetical protein
MGVKNDSTLVFNKYRVIFDPPLHGVWLKELIFLPDNLRIILFLTENLDF